MGDGTFATVAQLQALLGASGGTGPAESLTVATPAAQVAGVAFTLGGTYTNGPPAALDYQSDGAWTACGGSAPASGTFSCAGVTVAAANASATVKVRDHTTTTISVTSGVFAVTAAVPAVVYSSLSSTTPGASATAVYAFANGLPASAAVTLDGSAVTLTSGPTIATTSGSGATAAGTITFALAVPAAGTHSLGVSTSGAYAVTSAAHSWVTSTPLMLDLVSVPADRAFSLRKLRAAYNGPAIQVKRSSDSTTMDVGFVNGLLNTTALTTFVGSGTGNISRWYDQVGSNDAVPFGGLNGPEIVQNGTLVLQNSKPSIAFSHPGAPEALQSPNFSPTGLSAFLVMADSGAASSQMALFWRRSDINDPNLFSIQADSSTGTTLAAYHATSPAVYVTVPTGALMAYATVFNGTSKTTEVNGVLTNGTDTGPFSGTGAIEMGSDNEPGFYWLAPISEIVVFASALSSGDRETIHAAQRSYYGTP